MKRTIYILLAACIALASCTKESRELLYANQESKIETFVQNQQKTDPDIRVEHNGGATRVVIVEGHGPLRGVQFHLRFRLQLHSLRHQQRRFRVFREMGPLRQHRLPAPGAGPYRQGPAPRTSQRPGRSEGRRGVLHTLFRQACLRQKQNRHDSCKLSPCIQDLGAKRGKLETSHHG